MGVPLNGKRLPGTDEALGSSSASKKKGLKTKLPALGRLRQEDRRLQGGLGCIAKTLAQKPKKQSRNKWILALSLVLLLASLPPSVKWGNPAFPGPQEGAWLGSWGLGSFGHCHQLTSRKYTDPLPGPPPPRLLEFLHGETHGLFLVCPPPAGRGHRPRGHSCFLIVPSRCWAAGRSQRAGPGSQMGTGRVRVEVAKTVPPPARGQWPAQLQPPLCTCAFCPPGNFVDPVCPTLCAGPGRDQGQLIH